MNQPWQSSKLLEMEEAQSFEESELLAYWCIFATEWLWIFNTFWLSNSDYTELLLWIKYKTRDTVSVQWNAKKKVQKVCQLSYVKSSIISIEIHYGKAGSQRRLLPSHSSSSGLKLMAKSCDTCGWRKRKWWKRWFVDFAPWCITNDCQVWNLCFFRYCWQKK